METLSIRWFSLLYPTLGILFLSAGIWTLLARDQVMSLLAQAAGSDHPPAILLSILRTLLFLGIPSLIFSLWPLSWPELLFSVWFLVMLFTFGQLLVQWKGTARAIRERMDSLPGKVRFAGANLISIGLVFWLLLYHLRATAAG